MLITEAYREQNRLLHESNEHYGNGGWHHRQSVRSLASWGRLAILDYGAGKRTLERSLGPAYRVTSYDPAFPEIAATPEPHPVVVAGDMLEHVEPEHLDAVLADLWRVTIGKALFVIHCAAAKKTLPDGRNTHLVQESPDWWSQKLQRSGFRICQRTDDGGKPAKATMMIVERAIQ